MPSATTVQAVFQLIQLIAFRLSIFIGVKYNDAYCCREIKKHLMKCCSGWAGPNCETHNTITTFIASTITSFATNPLQTQSVQLTRYDDSKEEAILHKSSGCKHSHNSVLHDRWPEKAFRSLFIMHKQHI